MNVIVTLSFFGPCFAMVKTKPVLVRAVRKCWFKMGSRSRCDKQSEPGSESWLCVPNTVFWWLRKEESGMGESPLNTCGVLCATHFLQSVLIACCAMILFLLWSGGSIPGRGVYPCASNHVIACSHSKLNLIGSSQPNVHPTSGSSLNSFSLPSSIASAICFVADHSVDTSPRA